MTLSPQRRLRFSLLTLLLLLTTAAAVAGMFAAYRSMLRTAARSQERMAKQEAEFAKVRAENRRLRAEQGALTIEDPEKAYAIRLPRWTPWMWTYRVYLPPNRRYVLACQLRGAKPGGSLSGLSGDAHQPQDGDIFQRVDGETGICLSPGEYQITFAIDRSDDDQWHSHLTIRSPADRTVSGANTTMFGCGEIGRSTRAGLRIRGVGEEQESHKPTQKLLLLAGLPLAEDGPDQSNDSDALVALYIEPVTMDSTPPTHTSAPSSGGD